MFKRLIPLLSHSELDINKEETLFDVDACSINSSSKGSGSSEQVNRADIPTLRRRHSFVTPYAESIFEEEINRNNGNADMSIDPFDTTNSVKRSKSLSFSITRVPSFNTLRKKIPKSVHFEPSQEMANELDPVLVDSKDNKEQPESLLPRNLSKNHPLTSMEMYRSQENEIQRKYSSFLDDSLTSTSDIRAITDSKLFNVEEEIENSAHMTDKLSDPKENLQENNQCTSATNEKYVLNDEQSKDQRKGGTGLNRSNEKLILKMIICNLVDNEGINLDNLDDISLLKKLLSISEDMRLSKFQIDSENSLLKSQIKKYEFEMAEQGVILQKWESLNEESNSCKIKYENITAKYDLLLNLKNILEENEKVLRNNVTKLDLELAALNSCLQAEHAARGELLELINKYDNSEEIADKSDAVKGYIEQLFIKNESIIQENAHILEEKGEMKNEVESLNVSLKDNIDRLQEIQATLEVVTEENERLRTTLEEFKDEMSNSESKLNDKINDLNRSLENKGYEMNQISKVLSDTQRKADKLANENDNLKKELSNNLKDIEEANKQMKEELAYRNRMERGYNELERRIKESKASMNSSLIEANDQLGVKKEIILHLEEANSKLNAELNVLQLEKEEISVEKHNLVEENKKLAKINRDSKLTFDLLETYIEKSNKNVDVMSREYLRVLSSNEIVGSTVRKFTKNCLMSLQPIMNEESTEYAAKLFNKLEDLTLFSNEHADILHAISRFIPNCISDLVSQYTKTESLLQSEIDKRNNNYQRMLDKLTKIMEDSLSTTISKENINQTKPQVAKNCKENIKNPKHGIAYKNLNQLK